MRMFIFVVALLLSGAAHASPDCSNYGGATLAGCGAADFAVNVSGDAEHSALGTPREPTQAQVHRAETRHNIDLDGDGEIGEPVE